MRKRILVIDDEDIICLSLKEGLTDLGYKVVTASNGKEGMKKLAAFKPQVAFLDMRLSDENGLELIPQIKNIDREVEIIIMTAYGDVKTAVTAIKSGAFDYINKPFDLEEIHITLQKAFNNINLQKKLFLLEKEKELQSKYMLGEHPLIKEIFNKIEILAQNEEVTVLITGETGTGKELVASAIHHKSARRDSSMIKINCGAIPRQLLESELFGFEKNAFTGAASRKKGLLEMADGGTIFLDEIAEIPMDMQSKLLRFLEERRFKRIGGLEDIEVDVRVIAATNKNLEDAIRNNEFRQDLYYRLNVVPIHLPPLRDRGEDILILTQYFLNIYNKKFNKNIKDFTQRAKDKLLCYGWQGNIRELKNVLERIVILHNDQYIDLHHLPVEICNANACSQTLTSKEINVNQRIFTGNFSLQDEIQRLEQDYIRQALDYTKGNYTRASEILGINRFTLKRKIDKYFQ